MKITLEQLGTTVTIETEGDCQTVYEMADYCRELMLAQGYHPDSVSEAFPTEEDIAKEISEAISDHDLNRD